MKNFRTDQEEFWAGEFGVEYIIRNQGSKAIASNLNFFAKSLAQTRAIKSCIELGANIGLNLSAIKLLFPGVNVHAVEINATACDELKKVVPPANVYNESILDFVPKHKYDLVLIKGVLIHINPDQLKNVYDKLVASTSRYLMVAEYYNPSPTMITYRGHSDRLFKRDFSGEILEQYPQMQLLDYGFIYHRDPNFPQDDITWFLLEKRQTNSE